MTMIETPAISQWYRRHDKGYPFQVVAVDEDAETVELQHFDGDVEEIDLSVWRELDLEAIAPPEDCTGPMDDIECDDLGYSETDMSDLDWAEPLEEHAETEQEDGSRPEDTLQRSIGRGNDLSV